MSWFWGWSSGMACVSFCRYCNRDKKASGSTGTSYMVFSESVITKLVLLQSRKLTEEQKKQSEDNLEGMINIAKCVLENQLGQSVFNHVQIQKVRECSNIGTSLLFEDGLVALSETTHTFKILTDIFLWSGFSFSVKIMFSCMFTTRLKSSF